MGLYDETKPGDHFIDTGSHFYEVYETADGRYVAVGAIEPQFYAQLLAGLGLDPAALPKQMDRRSWPEMKRRFAEIFRSRTRAEWEARLRGHGRLRVARAVAARGRATRARRGSCELHGRRRRRAADAGAAIQPHAGARSPAHPACPAADTDAALTAWGIDAARVGRLREAGAIS